MSAVAGGGGPARIGARRCHACIDRTRATTEVRCPGISIDQNDGIGLPGMVSGPGYQRATHATSQPVRFDEELVQRRRAAAHVALDHPDSLAIQLRDHDMRSGDDVFGDGRPGPTVTETLALQRHGFCMSRE